MKQRTEEQRILHNLRQRIYTAKNPDKIREFNQRYYQLNKADLKTRQRERTQLYRDAGKYSDLQRKWTLQKRYGLTPEDYAAMLAKQGGACAICLQSATKTLHVDHNHSTGKVRGLLCYKCNVAIALMGDNPETLQAAINYLGVHVQFPSMEPGYADTAPLISDYKRTI